MSAKKFDDTAAISRDGKPKQVVAVFRSDWLPASETFIRYQLASMKNWHPVSIGLGRVQSPLALDTDQLAMPEAANGGTRRRIFQATRRSRRLAGLVQRSNAAVVHAHFGTNGVLIRPVARRLQLPLVVTFHGVDTSTVYHEKGLWGWLYRTRLEEIFKKDVQLIAVSESIKRSLIQIGASNSRVSVIYNGVIATTAADLVGSRHGVLFVGRLVEKKGVDDLLNAVALLPEGTQLTVVGTGPLENYLTDLAKALAINCKFTGSVTNQEVRKLMRSAEVVCVPSRVGRDGDVEGLPTVILEAGAEGTPVVATSHGGNAEAIVDGVTGLLVAERDVRGLADAVLTLMKAGAADPSNANRIAAHVSRQFDISKQTAKVEELYERVVEETVPRFFPYAGSNPRRSHSSGS